MAAWGTLQRLTGADIASFSEDDASGNFAAANASGILRTTLSGDTSNRGDGVYVATSGFGSLLRRWSAQITAWPTKTFNTPSWWKIGLYGSTNAGAVPNRSVGLWVELGSTSNTGYRAVNVHWLSGGVYQALAAWADGDLPIVLDIQEETSFSVGASTVHYTVGWTKTGGSRVVLWDSGVRATPGYWAASRIGVFQSGYYTSVVDCGYLLTEIWDTRGPTGSTTRTDLAKREGCKRRYFAMIDGWDRIAWEDDGTGTAPSATIWGTPSAGLVCLNRPTGELSAGIDLDAMKCDVSSITIELRNVPDPTDESKFYFAEMFAPGRHSLSTSMVAHLARKSADDPYVKATDTTLHVKEDISAWPTSGTLYLPSETITYNGLGDHQLLNCNRGQWPCVGGSRARTYKIPDESQSFNGIMLSTVPYTWIGRRIALKVVTEDDLNGSAQWQDASQAVVMWIGRIRSIRWNGAEAVWQLGCDSLLGDLDGSVAAGMKTTRLAGINLQGAEGRAFGVTVKSDDTSIHGHWGGYIELPRKWYPTRAELMNELHGQLAYARYNSTGIYGPSKFYESSNPLAISPKFYIGVANDELIAINHAGVRLQITIAPSWGAWPCHALQAAGIDVSSPIILDLDDGQIVTVPNDLGRISAYQPCYFECSGPYLVVEETAGFFSSQGDMGTEEAYVILDSAKLDPADNDDGSFIARYFDKSTSTYDYPGQPDVTSPCLLLRKPADWEALQLGRLPKAAYVGVCDGDDPATVKQVYCPAWKVAGVKRGPFRILLDTLLSTGTAGYNHATYDCLPYELSVGFDASLIDIQSFLDADAEIGLSDLSRRQRYVIGDPASWMELLQRECKLFGYVLCWDAMASKYKLKSINCHGLDTWVDTVSDGNSCSLDEMPDADSDESTIANQWKVKINYDYSLDKWGPPVIIDDEDSQVGAGVRKTIELEHPGIWIESETAQVSELLKMLLLQYQDIFRYPWWVVRRSLASEMYGRISAGDIVRFTSSLLPDPYGSGLMSVDTFALVLNIAWDPSTSDGDCTLLVYSQYQASLKTPWAGAALTNVAVAGGGLNNAAHQLTLVGWQWGDSSSDSHDGAWIVGGDSLEVIQRAPTNPLAPLRWTGIVAAKNYGADGANLLTVESNADFSGWSATSEYVVVPGYYDTTPTTMRAEHTWQANAQTLLLPGGDQAKRWG